MVSLSNPEVGQTDALGVVLERFEFGAEARLTLPERPPPTFTFFHATPPADAVCLRGLLC